MLSTNKHALYRFLEMIPGSLVWATLIFGIIFSFLKPVWVVYFIIVFSVYWLFRVLYFIFYVLVAWRKYRATIGVDWFTKVKSLPQWDSVYHLIILPTAGESCEVLETTFNGLMNSTEPKDKMIVVLSGEERTGAEKFWDTANKLKLKYQGQFFQLLFTLHPDGLVGEIKGKGANAHWAGHRAKELVDNLALPYEKIIVSYFDCDTVAHPQYFAHLAYVYLTHPNPTRASYQPVVLYNNNIWDAPAITRIVAFGTVFWLMTELARPERLLTFSSHSMSFKALVDVGFWQKDIVTDDSRIFLQGFVRYNGDYTVTPLYIPVSMDTVMSDTYLKTFRNLYKQQRRWAWGVEHFPYMVWHFFVEKNSIPLTKKMKLLFNQVEGMYSWATAPIILFILGYLPLWTINNEQKAYLIVQNAPYTLHYVMSAAMIGVLVSAALSFMLLPPKPRKYRRHHYLVMVLQWLLVPITLLIFGSIPSTDAQTRLMLGKYLGFWVTEKARKQS